MPTKDTASKVKPHTEVKLQFYTSYLARYLEILLRVSFVEKINIYDMYCGEGVYSDGNTGSAVRAVDAVWKAESSNISNKPIFLHLNDLNQRKVAKLKSVLANRSSLEKSFCISYSAYEAFELLDKLSIRFKQQNRNVRNLVFIDPYGYKSIKRDVLEKILEGGRTEVIIFLPIEQMYRFRNMTVDEVVDKSYRPLKEFVDQFGIDVSSISSEKEFIQEFSKCLNFYGNYFSTYYAIKNHSGHYYGMFFVTANFLGLEKIVEVKWELDSQEGEGFTGPSQKDFFLEADKLSFLESELKVALQATESTNVELYSLVVNLGFLPKHANNILKEWQKKGLLEVYYLEKDKDAKKGSFKLNYKDFRNGDPLLRFSLKQGW
ncbi:three-Cys-motif partner protein TcmP [Porticoccus sp.]